MVATTLMYDRCYVVTVGLDGRCERIYCLNTYITIFYFFIGMYIIPVYLHPSISFHFPRRRTLTELAESPPLLLSILIT